MRKTNIIMMILLFLFSHTGCGSFAQQGTEAQVTSSPLKFTTYVSKSQTARDILKDITCFFPAFYYSLSQFRAARKSDKSGWT